MKHIRLLALIAAALLMSAALLLASCDKTPAAEDTTAEDTTVATEAPTEAPTEPSDEETTEAPTDPAETEADTPAETNPSDEETTEAETVFTPPAANPDEAAAAGLPLDGTAYTVGGEAPAVDPKAQYDYLKVYAHAYEDKSFTLYGNIIAESGNLLLSVGNGMNFFLYYADGNAPVPGSYVKVTATFAKTVDRGSYVDFDCFTMMASATEVLGEAKGPNGGKLMFITASSLNVRTSSDTSTSDNILGQLSHGDMVEVFEQDAKGWYRIEFNGQTAYISNKYVSETKP